MAAEGQQQVELSLRRRLLTGSDGFFFFPFQRHPVIVFVSLTAFAEAEKKGSPSTVILSSHYSFHSGIVIPIDMTILMVSILCGSGNVKREKHNCGLTLVTKHKEILAVIINNKNS